MKSKVQWRRELKARRAALTEDEVQELSWKIIWRLAKTINWSTIHSLHVYVPIIKNNEVDSWYLVEHVWQTWPQARVAVPVLGKDEHLHSAFITRATKWDNTGIFPMPTDGEKVPNNFQFSVVVVPVLGFDKQGHRLGYGKGHYDEFLAKQTKALKIGLAYEVSLVAEGLPHETHDQKLDWIMTESRVLRASGPLAAKK